MQTLDDLVLKSKNPDGSHVVDIAEYYNTRVRPLDMRRFHVPLKGKTAICCLNGHTDTDPSFGVFTSKTSDTQRYSCFGCGGSGDVIKLHQHIQYFYHNRSMTRKESAEDLCRLYNLDMSGVNIELEGDDADTAYARKMMLIQSKMDSYTLRDYQKDLMKVRQSISSIHRDTAIARIHEANVKMMATYKGLVD